MRATSKLATGLKSACCTTYANACRGTGTGTVAHALRRQAQLRDFVDNKTQGGLALHRAKAMHAQNASPVTLSFHPDGFIRYGDIVILENVASQLRLSVAPKGAAPHLFKECVRMR
jgi:hypothetical protein